MPTALVSVSDKTELEEFCSGLVERGWTIVSTGGTAGRLNEAGIPVTGVSEWTRSPEMMGGRVKTLHPWVHAGILARRNMPNDLEQLERHGSAPIDLVAVNLYPFERTIARESATLAEALEQIDIGGPTLLRAAAKNHEFVWSVCDPADYARILAALDRAEDDEDAPALRRRLAVKVFRHTARYDATIAGYLDDLDPFDGPTAESAPAGRLVSLVRVQELRYGENPDQRASFFRDSSRAPWGLPALVQLHGKELSYNNLLDVDAALTTIAPFHGRDRPTCAILKHTTPCGIAVGRSLLDAYRKALACDPISAFGSVVAFTQPVTEAVAEALVENFVECLVAPAYADAALVTLQKRKNLRILRPERPEAPADTPGHLWQGVEARGVRGGLLLQTAARPVAPDALRGAEGIRVATERAPSDEEWADLAFAWAAVQSVKSNAILLARDGGSIGIGAGQMSRVDSVRLALTKAGDAELATEGSVLASDAFFPFRDGVDAAAAGGVRAVIQPGGSVRDDEVVQAANEQGIAMVMTGRRLFRH